MYRGKAPNGRLNSLSTEQKEKTYNGSQQSKSK